MTPFYDHPIKNFYDNFTFTESAQTDKNKLNIKHFETIDKS